jgi:putative ABC transport system permease protein
MNFKDIFSLAFRTVRGNKLRTGLTVAIIAFGIMALVGIITAIKAMNQKFTESFSTMGANGFTIRYKERNIQFGGGNDNELKLSKKGKKKEKKSSLGKKITKDEAELFINNYQFPALKGVSIFGNRNNIVSYETRKTSPNVTIFGGDENYLQMNGFSIAAGRNFSRGETQTGHNVCILGHDVAKKLFKDGPERAVNSIVRVNNIPYRVLGVLQSRGASFGFSRDNLVIATFRNVDRNFPSGFSYVIGVMANDLQQVKEGSRPFVNYLLQKKIILYSTAVIVLQKKL